MTFFVSGTDLRDWFSLGVWGGGLQVKLPAAEIAATLDAFRLRHLSELREVGGGGKEMVGCRWGREGVYGFRGHLGCLIKTEIMMMHRLWVVLMFMLLFCIHESDVAKKFKVMSMWYKQKNITNCIMEKNMVCSSGAVVG